METARGQSHPENLAAKSTAQRLKAGIGMTWCNPDNLEVL
jgi:hypothetical protein